jgi:lysophospholipase L1-like esterase
VVVLNAGIGGNQVVGPALYSPNQPYSGGPSALMRLERDILSLSGVSTVIWLEGVNDFSKNGNASAEAVMEGLRTGVSRLRERIPGVQVLGATVVSALGSTSEAHGFDVQNDKRKALNQFIRSSGVFDGVVEFDPAILDPVTGGMKTQFVHDTTVGGPGDKLHPNRLGYQAMGLSIDLPMLTGR